METTNTPARSIYDTATDKCVAVCATPCCSTAYGPCPNIPYCPDVCSIGTNVNSVAPTEDLAKNAATAIYRIDLVYYQSLVPGIDAGSVYPSTSTSWFGTMPKHCDSVRDSYWYVSAAGDGPTKEYRARWGTPIMSNRRGQCVYIAAIRA